ncbi:MAG: ribose 1,5-bisphosphate isomerase, partial [Methanomassiliicoccales archaeon]
LDSRPTAVALWNGVHAVTRGLDGPVSVDGIRELIAGNAEDFIRRAEEAKERIGRIGGRRLRDGDRVLTHCNSSVALSVIKSAHQSGKDIEVYATESRPWRQGLITIEELSKEGISTTFIVDSAVRLVMKEVDAVLVGADTVASNGAVINKIGTSQIALVAHETRVPFMVCTETFKFSPHTLEGELVDIEERDPGEVLDGGQVPDGVRIWNPVFDATPPEYIDSIVTEIGVIPPFAAYEVIVRQLGQEFMFENDRG